MTDAPPRLAPLLAEVVRARIAAAGRTQADLAKAVGITEKHLSQVLNGRATATVQLWDRLMNASSPYQVDAAHLAALVNAAQAGVALVVAWEAFRTALDAIPTRTTP